MFSMHTNVSAMQNKEDLRGIYFNIGQASERISSGKRINSGADDPSGLGITKGMTAVARGFQVNIQNAQDVLHFVRLGDEGMNEISDMLNRMKELAVRAANEAVLTSSDRTKLDNEFQSLYSEITRTAKTTKLRGEGETSLTPISWQGPGIADIMYVFDYSGSMGPAAAAVRAQLSGFISSLESNGVDWNIGLVEYSDVNTGQAVIHHDLTGNQATAQAYLDGIVVAGGGDLPESGLEGLMSALNNTSFRYAAGTTNYFRHIIMITDVPRILGPWTFDVFHDDAGGGYAGTGLSAFDTVTVANSLAAAGIQTHIAGDVNQPQSQLVTTTTGGLLGAIGTLNTTLDNIMNAITSTDAVASEEFRTFNIQVNPFSYGNFEFTFEDCRTIGLNMTAQSLTSTAGAHAAIDEISEVIDQLGMYQAKYGELDQKLEHIIDELEMQYMNLQSARSKIEDADIAAEATALTKNQIIERSTLAAGMYANNSQSIVLNLLSENGIGTQGAL
jgi:flagellin